MAITGMTGGNDSFGSSFSTSAGGCGAWLAMGTSAVAVGLGAGGKTASDGVLMVGAIVDGGAAGVSCASVTGAEGVVFFDAGVTAGGFVGLLDIGPATTVGVFVTFAAVVGAVAIVGGVTVVSAIGAGAFDVAGVAGSDEKLIASVEISVRRTPAATVSLFMIDAIISVAGFVAVFVAGFVATMGVGAGAGIGTGNCVTGRAAA